MRDQAVLRQWQMRLERAEYEAALAERRYQEVDPSQRLVASTLERRWNDTLLSLEDLKKQYADFEQQKARVATPIRDMHFPEGFNRFVTSTVAPVASGWSTCRVGLAPTGKRRLYTAHTPSCLSRPSAIGGVYPNVPFSAVDCGEIPEINRQSMS